MINRRMVLLHVLSFALLMFQPSTAVAAVGTSFVASPAPFIGHAGLCEKCQVSNPHSRQARPRPLTTLESSPQSTAEAPRKRAKLNGKLPIISRTVPLGIPSNNNHSPDELSVTVWEVEQPKEMIELWWSSGETDKDKMGDPFGVVMWPGSILAAREMYARRDEIVNKTVLVLGAGTGLEAQAAALLGAGRVIATDINALSLRLLDYGVGEAGLDNIVESCVFDLFSANPLPQADVILAADILYNEELGMQVGKRMMELLNMSEVERPAIIATDSQRFHGTDFVPLLNKELARVHRPTIDWEDCMLEVTTSGILVDEDQTYNITARMISM